MIVLIFLVGSQSGLLLGALLCIRFVRQGVTGDLGPKLRQIEAQLDTIGAELLDQVVDSAHDGFSRSATIESISSRSFAWRASISAISALSFVMSTASLMSLAST